ncbi:MAG: VrrA/YqfQ family protein [Paenisporosarcina sp.]
MRYESFYPFSQGRIQPSNQPFPAPQRSSFFGSNPFSYGQGNNSPPPAQSPFGFGSRAPRGVTNRPPNGFYGGPPNQSQFGGGGPPNQPQFGGGGPPNQPQFGGGGLQARMEQYLQTADRFLSTAQQLSPMVKQVAPMVQNIPALWKIYRGFQGMPNVGTAANAGTVANAGRVATAVSRSSTSPLPSGLSQPRIFQPPI